VLSTGRFSVLLVHVLPRLKVSCDRAPKAKQTFNGEENYQTNFNLHDASMI